jgi:two-component system cell cycle sensor histidine kinase/response regulator CckA
MKDKDKAQKQPTKELTQLRKRVAERESSEQERKEAKEALKKNEHDKAAVLDSISELVVYHDTKMRIQWTNKAASESVGFDPQQLVGRHCYEIWQQRRKPCLGCPVVKARKSGRSQEAEMTSPDGRIWLVRGYPVQDAKGNVKGAVEVTSDITERKRAEEALREERDQAQQYLDIAEVMFVALNKKGEITLINRKGNQILGYKEGELLGKNWPASCVPSYLRKGVKGVFRKLMAGEGKTTEFYENPVLTKSGTERIIAWHNTLLKDATGNIIGTLSSGEDITERKQAEEELRKSEGRFRTLVETMKVGLNTIDENGVITYVNDQFCSMLGYSMDDMVGHPNFDFLDEENRQTLECLFAKRKKGEQDPAPYELTWLRKDGQKVHTIMSPTPFFDRGGHHEIRYTGAYAIITDITELKQTEEALKESEEKYRDLINGMNDTAWVINFEGKFIDANNAAVAVLGYSREELLSMGPSDIDGTLDAEAIKTLIKQMPTDKIQVFETTHTTKDGTVIPVEINSSLITYQGERAILSIARDITERKRGEAALEQTRLLLEAVLEQSPVPIVVVSGPDFVVRYKNRAAIDFLGVTDEPTYLGLTLPQVKRRQTWQDLNPDGTPTDLLNLPLARALRGETTRNEEYGVIRKDGTQRWELVSGTPIYSRSGELVAGLVVFPDITERKQAEAERQAHMWFIESMIRVNEALYGTPDLEQMMSDALAVVLSIYNCDRASLVYPCDPEAASWRAIMEQSRSEYPGPPALGLEVPVDQDFASAFRTLIASSTPVKFGPGSPHPLPGEIARLSQVQSQLAMAIYPKGDKPWAFVIHQCSYPRVWTSEEERLLQAIGNRLADGLTTLLAHRSLRESEERFRLAFENANSGVCLVDLEGNIARVNHKMCEIFGYTNEELQHMTVNDIAHPEDIDKSPEFKQKTLQGEIDQGTFEKRYFHKKGHDVTCQVSSSLVRDANGSPLYFIVHIQDITERKQAEELLKKERETSLSILENAPYGVALIDKGGQYAYINPEFTTITGYTLQDVPTGKDWAQKAFPDPKYREKMIQVWKEDRQKAHIMNREFSVTCKNGAIREIDIRSTFLREGRAVIVLRDITEQKRTEERMESLQEQLRQSQKMEAIGRLAGGIAHDFNNLLTIIKGYSQLSLIDLKEDTVLKTNIAHIDTATDRAADLVRQLLAFSRRQILEMKVWDLNTILTNLHNMLRRLIGEDIELVTLLAEDLGRVKTDLGWIEQAIMNLVVNARDAMPSGGKLTIETGNADLDEAYVGGRVGVKPGRYVMLSVSDTGVGMTPEVTERLFEPFFSTKDKDKGTGLGLSTVYGIVKQSDGDIWVYSEPGKGSTFKIYLPRVDEPLEEQREKVQSDELLQGCETILLVEDEEEVRKLAVRVLERQGYKVLEARNGDKALRICEHHREPIHLMLTDVVMPGMNGHEVAKRLLSFHPETKVLYMSGYTDDAIVLHGVLVKGVHYIQKPFTVDALTKKVREVLEK